MPNVVSVLLLLCCVIIIIQHTLRACRLVTVHVAVVNGNYFRAAGRLQTGRQLLRKTLRKHQVQSTYICDHAFRGSAQGA